MQVSSLGSIIALPAPAGLSFTGLYCHYSLPPSLALHTVVIFVFMSFRMPVLYSVDLSKCFVMKYNTVTWKHSTWFCLLIHIRPCPPWYMHIHELTITSPSRCPDLTTSLILCRDIRGAQVNWLTTRSLTLRKQGKLWSWLIWTEHSMRPKWYEMTVNTTAENEGNHSFGQHWEFSWTETSNETIWPRSLFDQPPVKLTDSGH